MGDRTGSPNRNKQALIKLLQQQYPGYQPVLKMARHAMEMSRIADEAIEPDIDLHATAVSAHDKVAKYVTPALKAVEHRAEDGGDVQLIQVKFVE